MTKVVKIVLPNYPTKLPMTKGRRKKYFTKEDKLPKKLQGDRYIFKKDRLFDTETKSFLIKNEKFIDKPRYQPLSYNKISTRLKIPVLIKLKEWMTPYMPSSLNMSGPLRVYAIVYDFPIPLEKDLDNMHIYYKAFLDLLKQRGMIKNDDKRYITEAGGFTFHPIYKKEDRALVFIIEKDERTIIRSSMMYNLEQKSVKRGTVKGVELRSSEESLPGILLTTKDVLYMNFGKTKIIKVNADRLFRAAFNYCINNNTECWVSQEFYRIHSDRIQRFLLDIGIQVNIKI